MRRRLLAAAALLGALPCLLPALTAAGAEPVVPETVVKCAECGMSAKVANRFTSRIVRGGNTQYFCDIGDMAAFIERTRPTEYTASVHDFKSGEWVDVGNAHFVIDKNLFASPMGWGIAAFRDRAGATGAPMDFEALLKALAMKVFAAVAALVGGVLLLVIPRFVFPACEYLGRGRMHCTDAAHGEFVVGGLLVAAGAVLLIVKAGPASIFTAACAVLLCAAAFFVPAYTRYCANPDMACRYGMVPSVRFIAVAVGIIEVAALTGLVRESKRRDT